MRHTGTLELETGRLLLRRLLRGLLLKLLLQIHRILLREP